ncbi:MAG TPA: glutamate carboxypeptidase [Polyangiaceae bacterium]|nr:glutamate carboxypeptidase [Polyangiaceae bacterium]
MGSGGRRGGSFFLTLSLLVAAAQCASPHADLRELGPEAAAAADKPGVPDRSLLHAAEQEKAAVLQDLATLVNQDSGTDDAEGLSHVSDWLATRLRDLGATVDVLPESPSAGTIVRGTLHGKGRLKLLLMIHFDTVFPKGEAARRPYEVKGTRAFGPGVADAKGGAAVMLHALAIAKQRGFSAYDTLTVLFDSDEEKGSSGSRDTLQKTSAEQDYVLSYEPPDGDRVIVQTNGIAIVKLDVKGRGGHASEPEKASNAALELAAQVSQLRDLGDATKGTTVTWTVLKAGDRINVIPDSASATADMRYSDPSELERVDRDAKRLLEKRLVPDAQVAVTVDPRRPPFPRNAASERLAATATRAYRELGRPLTPVAMRYGTDAGFAYHPGSAKPAVLEGMGIVGGGLHSAAEWADLESVVPRLYLTVRMLELLAAVPTG